MNNLDLTTRLRRIEGQIRGISTMLAKDVYCIDILTQCKAVRAAMQTVERSILHKHLASCVKESFSNDNLEEQEQKIEEVVSLFASKWSS